MHEMYAGMPASPANDARRRARRAALVVPVHCRPLGGAPGFAGETVDISADGLAVWSERALFRGSRLSLSLRLPGMEDRVEAEAEVAHLREREGRFLLGLRFRALDRAVKAEIARFVLRSLLPTPAAD